MKSKTVVFHADFSAKKNGPGTESSPWRSVESAQRALRALRRTGKLNGVDVLVLCKGIERIAKPLVFRPEDGVPSGSRHTVTWRGEGARAVIAGSRRLTGFAEGTINGVSCWTLDIPEVRAGKWRFTQLWVNGQRRMSARLPHGAEWYRFTGVPEEEAKKDTNPGDFFHCAMAACFRPGDCFEFRNPEDVDVVIPDHWYDNHLRVSSVDVKKNVIRFSSKGFSRLSKDETGMPTRYRLDNVREGCLEPGDWYLDRKEGRLYYIPKAGESRDSSVVEAPVAETLLRLEGACGEEGPHIHNLRFEFFEFRHNEWVCPSESYTRQASIHAIGSILFRGAENCALYGCDIHGTAGYGVDVMRGCHDCRIVACAIHDLGGGGVKVAPEDGLQEGWSKELSLGGRGAKWGWGMPRKGLGNVRASHTTVSDCSIHDGGLIHLAAVGVWVGDSASNRIVHNDIHDFRYTGISVGWNWGFMPATARDNRIEWNHVWRIGLGVLSDMGGIYTLGRQPGTSVSNNFIHDVESYGYGGWGLYTDEGSSWITLEGNVVLRTKTDSFHQHFGRDNILRHNLLADARTDSNCRVSRCMIPTPITFERNLCIFPGWNGNFWRLPNAARAHFDYNAYSPRPDAPNPFTDAAFASWQAGGFDPHGRVCNAVLLDSAGGVPSLRIDPAGAALTGVTPERVARIVAECGPRHRGKLPESIDSVKPEPETKRPLVEALLWPWDVEWPEALIRNKGLNGGTIDFAKVPQNDLPVLGKGESTIVSMTLENRGDAAAKGAYRFRVVPAGAARLDAPKSLAVSLKPDGRASWRGTLTATGKTPRFLVEAVSDNPALPSTAIHFGI